MRFEGQVMGTDVREEKGGKENEGEEINNEGKEE